MATATSTNNIHANLVVEYGEMLSKMRKVFKSGKTKDLAWRRQQLEQVHKLYREHYNDVCTAVTADLGGGKFRGAMEIGGIKEVDYALDRLSDWTTEQWESGWFDRNYIRPEPKGVVLIMAPWNFPWNLLLMPLVSAVAAGNCVVLKPSELSKNCAALLAKLAPEYMDPECVQVVQGGVPETTALLELRFDHIFFTGSVGVGQVISAAAAKHLTPVTMELGGKSPAIVDETALIRTACERIACSKWINTGQVCVAPDYVLVHESKLKEFVDTSVALIKDYGKDPKQSQVFGRIINERNVDRIEGLIKSSGGTNVCGGAETIDREARYVPPTIVVSPSLESTLMSQEIFGPVLPVLPYKTLDEAVEIVQARGTPLALYVFSQSSANIETVLSRCQSGGVAVNSCLEQCNQLSLPFGGLGDSGHGMSHGKFGFEDFSHFRAVRRKSTLPLMRGSEVPLVPVQKLLQKVFDPVVKVRMLGIVPRPLKRLWRIRALRLVFFALVVFLFHLGTNSWHISLIPAEAKQQMIKLCQWCIQRLQSQF